MKKIIIGLLFILLGIVIALNQLDVLDIEIFFEGWWALFIIVPAFIGLFEEDDKAGNLVVLGIGILLLLGARDIIDFALVGSLIFPIILIYIGLRIMTSNKVSKKVEKLDLDEDTYTVFSETNLNPKEYNGGKFLALFGGITLDLKDAKLKEETYIEISTVFGGMDILVPTDVNVEVKPFNILGGVENKAKSSKDAKKTIYISSTNIFGGVDIKWT